VIHRDVKPSNLIINLDVKQGPRVRLLDFGIGKVMTSVRKNNPALTRPGEVVGTPMYMAPEQMTEGAIDPRVDIYAAGVVLFEMLTGRPPFRAPSVAETFVAVLHDEMPKLEVLRPGLPASLSQLVHTAAARRASNRFATVHDMRVALEAAIEELPTLEVGQPPFVAQPEEQHPTLVWRRNDALEDTGDRPRYSRPLPPSLARTLRAANPRDSSLLLPSCPVGFLARRPVVPAAKANVGWRVESATF